MNEETVDQWALSALAKGAVIMPAGRPSISNREEIRAWIRRLLDQYEIEHFQLTTEEIVKKDWAYEKGVYLLEASSTEGGEKIQERGKVLFIWKKGEEGRWEGTHASWNDDGYWP
jgi:ketosteroid isomerase-like protein